MTALVDFHNHFAGAAVRPGAAARWPSLKDRAALEASLEGVTRVVSTPPEFMAGPAEPSNDAMAALVQANRGRMFGVATVDAYAGEPAAKELSRAMRQLALRGVFVESAKGGQLPDCAEAQPTLSAAADLGVPVFLHPVPDEDFRRRFKACGTLTERLARGTVNSAAILAMIEGGLFERHRGLKVVVTALALGGLLLADRVPEGVYIDTTAMKPATLRGSIELVGPSRVVAGTDWPVVQEKDFAARLDGTLALFGLSPADRQRVAAGNALNLIGAT